MSFSLFKDFIAFILGISKISEQPSPKFLSLFRGMTRQASVLFGDRTGLQFGPLTPYNPRGIYIYEYVIASAVITGACLLLKPIKAKSLERSRLAQIHSWNCRLWSNKSSA